MSTPVLPNYVSTTTVGFISDSVALRSVTPLYSYSTTAAYTVNPSDVFMQYLTGVTAASHWTSPATSITPNISFMTRNTVVEMPQPIKPATSIYGVGVLILKKVSATVTRTPTTYFGKIAQRFGRQRIIFDASVKNTSIIS